MTSIPPKPSGLHAYCDESSTESRFMVYGGIIAVDTTVPGIDAEITEWRKQHNMNAEIKWAKVSNKKLEKYVDLIDYFFMKAKARRCHFKSVVFDTHQIDYKTHHESDNELGFYKFYYQFLLHKFASYAVNDDWRLWVHIDQKSTTKERLVDLRKALNNGIRKKYGRSCDVVKAVEARVSHECNLIQIADVLMGAIAYHCNGCHRAENASPARRALAMHVASRAGLQNLAQSTPRGKEDFEIWRFVFRKRS